MKVSCGIATLLAATWPLQLTSMFIEHTAMPTGKATCCPRRFTSKWRRKAIALVRCELYLLRTLHRSTTCSVVIQIVETVAENRKP